jgi:hypothetical protein
VSATYSGSLEADADESTADVSALILEANFIISLFRAIAD